MAIKQGEDGDRESFNALYRCLQRPERRRILFGLVELPPQEVLKIPEDVHVGERDIERLEIELVHSHLPMLEAAGLIRWEQDPDLLQKGPRFAEMRTVIQAVREHDPIRLGI